MFFSKKNLFWQIPNWWFSLFSFVCKFFWKFFGVGLVLYPSVLPPIPCGLLSFPTKINAVFSKDKNRGKQFFLPENFMDWKHVPKRSNLSPQEIRTSQKMLKDTACSKTCSKVWSKFLVECLIKIFDRMFDRFLMLTIFF